MKRRILLFILIFFSISIFSNIGTHFYDLDINSDLPIRSISTVYKDKSGFLWIATSNGLGRYDGSRLKTYYIDCYNSIWTNNIAEIQEDAYGNLWMKRDNTEYYFLYNRSKDCFINDIFPYLGNIGYHCKTTPKKVLVTDNDLWFVYKNSICCFNIKRKRYSFFPIKNVSDIKVCDNIAYIIQKSGMIARISIKNKFVIFDNSFINVCQKRSFVKFNLYVDKNKGIWVYSKGSNNGLYHYDKNKRWVHFGTSKTDDYQIKSNQICTLLDDGKGYMWMALEHAGIDVFSKKDNTITPLHSGESGLRSNKINTLYLDNDHTIWIGYLNRGISFSTNHPVLFESHFLPGNMPSEFKDEVISILEDKQGNIWVGTDGNGLTVLDKNYKIKSHYDLGNSNNVAICIYEDKFGRIWTGTFRNGLYCYDKGRMIHIKRGEKGLKDDNIWSITEDAEGRLWIGGLNNGLQKWNELTGKFDKPIGKMWLNQISSPVNGKLYVASYGLVSIDTKTNKCSKEFTGNRRGTQTILDKEIKEIFYDSRGLLWLGGELGLSVYDERKDSIYYIDRNHGLSNNVVHGIVEDKKHNMWVTTEYGLNKIKVYGKNGNYTFSLHNYSEKDGLSSNFFNTRSIFVNRNGNIYFGGDKGFNVYKYDNEIDKSKKTNVILTDIQLGNEIIKVDSLYNGKKILDADINICKEVRLDYSDRNITIFFASPRSITGSSVRYAYKLESSFSSNRIYTNNANVTFDHLSARHYVFRVKACNSDGEWGDETSVKIYVSPPYYLSWWAYLSYLFIAIAVALYVYYTMRRRQEEKLRIQQIKMELDKQKHIDKIKFDFFTNVSHDFRTPLSLIVTPIEKLIEDYQDKPIMKTLQIIHNNAMQLTMLINQLLNFRKLDESGEKTSLSKGDYIAFVKSLCSEFELMQKDKMIKLSCVTEIKELTTAFDKDKVRKILTNLLSNAFKFSPKNSEVTITINTDDKNVSTSVKDHGIGVPDKEKALIFNRFYQIDHKHENYGSGIGLNIVSQYVSLLNGKITLEDNVPNGCIFTFTFPISKNSDAENKTEEPFTEQKIESELDKRSKLLIVEDNDDFRNFIDECLNIDYQILKAADGQEALDLLHSNDVDLVISDIMMPVMDGLELCEKIKNDIALSHIPVILLTARATDEHKLEGLRDGADDYITKPFNLNILKLRIEKILSWSSQRHVTFETKMDVKPSEITISSLDEQLIAKAMKAVEDNMDNSEFSVEDLGSAVGMSRGHLYRKLMSITGKGPLEFIRVLRLKRACQYLEQSQMNVSEIAYITGFSTPKIFSKYFKEMYDISPSEYKKENK